MERTTRMGRGGGEGGGRGPAETNICVHCFTKRVEPGVFQCVNCGLTETLEEINRRYENL